MSPTGKTYIHEIVCRDCVSVGDWNPRSIYVFGNSDELSSAEVYDPEYLINERKYIISRGGDTTIFDEAVGEFTIQKIGSPWLVIDMGHSTVWIPMLTDSRYDLQDKVVCIPIAGMGAEYIVNLSDILAPRGPVSIDLVSTYSRLYRIMTPQHLIDTMQIVISLRDKHSDMIVMALHGQSMRYKYTQNPTNPSPNLPQFVTAIYKLTGCIMEWELGIIAYTQGLSIEQTWELYEKYRSRQFRRITKRKLSDTI